MDIPKKVVKKKMVYEWIIGKESRPTSKRTFLDGIDFATREMNTIVDLTFDDAYHVRAGDGGEIIIYCETVEKEN